MADKKQTAKAAKNTQQENDARMPLSKKNYLFMLIGLAVIIIGFLLMAGGGSDDPGVFNPAMFSFRRITLAPIVVIAGFAVEIFAILKRFDK